MGDQDTQLQQERQWWAADGSEELASSPSFDEPLQWPDAAAWEDLFEGGPPTQPAYVPEDFGAGLLFSEAAAAPDDDDGGPATQAHLEPLPQSIWAPDPSAGDPDDAVVAATVAALGGSGTAVAAPTPAAVADADHGRLAGPAWLQRLQIRHGSAAVVALACCVSLVLLGMFLSVRARDDLPTQTSDTQPAGQVATQASTSVPPPTTAATSTTASPPSTLSLSDLIPAGAATDGSGTGGTGGTAGTTARTSPATTAAPSRSAAPSGGSGGGSSAQPTNTTAAPEPEPTSPPPTSPPQQDTTTTPTTARRVLPTIPDFDYTIPSYTIPSFPTPGSSQRTTGN
jgi:hypothetical protein